MVGVWICTASDYSAQLTTQMTTSKYGTQLAHVSIRYLLLPLFSSHQVILPNSGSYPVRPCFSFYRSQVSDLDHIWVTSLLDPDVQFYVFLHPH
jgi:hypothetical protein